MDINEEFLNLLKDYLKSAKSEIYFLNKENKELKNTIKELTAKKEISEPQSDSMKDAVIACKAFILGREAAAATEKDDTEHLEMIGKYIENDSKNPIFQSAFIVGAKHVIGATIGVNHEQDIFKYNGGSIDDVYGNVKPLANALRKGEKITLFKPHNDDGCRITTSGGRFDEQE